MYINDKNLIPLTSLDISQSKEFNDIVEFYKGVSRESEEISHNVRIGGSNCSCCKLERF